jgi:FkbM family methyltransferase
MDIKLRSNITMPWNSKLCMRYRDEPIDGFNDWNVIESSLCQDEYMLDKIPFKRNVAIDLGAHLGAVTVRMASMGLKVYAVEALPENVELLEANVKINKLSNLVRIYPNAIGANDTDILYAHYGNKNTASGRHHRYVGIVDSQPHPADGIDIVEIKSISLDTIFKENNITRCNFLKTDCEGGEWDCFRCASKETISKIDWITAEIHPRDKYTNKNDLLNLLHGMFEDVTHVFSSNPTVISDHPVFRRKDQV